MIHVKTRASFGAVVAATALLAVSGCSATAPVDEAADKTSVTLENCGTESTFQLPIEKVVATSNAANIGTILRVGGLDRLAAVVLNTNNDAVMESMFGPGIADVPHLDGTITMETILGKQADLVVGSYSGLFKGASGVTPESLQSNNIDSYVISDSCRQSAAADSALGTMGPWDALRADVTNYGKLFGTEDTAAEALTELDSRLARLESAPDAADKPKVLIYDSGEEDLYTSGGNGAPNGIIDAAGGTNVFADVDNTWFKASWETVAKSEPDVIVIMDYKKSADEVQARSTRSRAEKAYAISTQSSRTVSSYSRSPCSPVGSPISTARNSCARRSKSSGWLRRAASTGQPRRRHEQQPVLASGDCRLTADCQRPGRVGCTTDARRCSGRHRRDVRVAYLDVSSPSLHEELDRAHVDDVDKVVLIPVAVPRDRYLLTWTSKAVANWRETRIDAELEVTLHESETLEGAVAAQLIDELDSAGKPITASPASYRSPAWSVIEQHDRHLLVCKGPRCMAYGAGPLHRAMSAAAKGTSAKVTGTGCLSPCNLGPLVIANPGGTWFGHVDAGDAEALVAGQENQLEDHVLDR